MICKKTRGKVGSYNVNSCVSFITLESDSFDKFNMLLFSNAMQINMSRAISCSLIEVNLSLLNSVKVEISSGLVRQIFRRILITL